MNSEHRDQRDGLPDEVADLEAQFFRRPSRGRVSEQLLWSLALGALSVEEEDAALELIAGDEEASRAWARISRAVQAGEARVAPAATEPKLSLARQMLETARQVLGRAWEGLQLRPEEVEAVFLRQSRALAVCIVRGEEVQAGTTLLTREALSSEEGPATTPVAAFRKKARMADGTVISVVSEPDGAFTVTVSLIYPPVEGLVRVKKLAERGGQRVALETGVQGRLDKGVATLKECPEGALQIVVPGERLYVVVLGHELPEPTAPPPAR
jgi:hypothetical protein